MAIYRSQPFDFFKLPRLAPAEATTEGGEKALAEMISRWKRAIILAEHKAKAISIPKVG